MKLLQSVYAPVLLFVGLMLGLTSCSFTEPEITAFTDVEVVEMHDKTAQIIFSFTINNPNRLAITLQEGYLDIAVNRIYLGKATLSESVEIPGSGTYEVSLKMNMKFEKDLAEISIPLGLAVLTNDLKLHIQGEAKGSYGLLSKKLAINHSERIDWDSIKKLLL